MTYLLEQFLVQVLATEVLTIYKLCNNTNSKTALFFPVNEMAEYENEYMKLCFPIIWHITDDTNF